MNFKIILNFKIHIISNMNDFERIYTVIKTQYTCGVPYYNYGKCVYDELSQNYIQEGKLDLLKSDGYSNVPLNDIPIACNQPTNTIIMCSPPVLEIQKPEPGFRLKFQNSAYLDENLILKSPSDYQNTIFIMENTGTNSCLKSIVSGKYVSYDSQNSIVWSDTCSEVNNIFYDNNKLLFKNNNLCINPTTYYPNTIPNNTTLSISSCSMIMKIDKEDLSIPLEKFASVFSIASTDDIQDGTTTSVPTTLKIPTKYSLTVPISVSTKVKISNTNSLLLIQNYYSSTNQIISTVYISRDFGKNWTRINISFNNIEDISVSYDGKYVLVIDTTNFYHSSDGGNTFSTKVLDISTFIYRSYFEVKMSIDGRVQIATIKRINYKTFSGSTAFKSIIQISYDYGTTFIKTERLTPISILVISKNGEIAMIIEHNSTTKKYISTYLNNESEFTFDLPDTTDSITDIHISSDSKNIYILYTRILQYSNDYGATWKINTLTPMINLLNAFYFRNYICISNTGKYIFLIMTKRDTVWRGYIFYSTDYGSTFELFKTDNFTLNNTLIEWKALDILPDGSKLVLSEINNVYFIDTKLPVDTLIVTDDEKMILPDNEYKYTYPTNISYNRIIKSGRDLFFIDDTKVSFYEGNSIVNLNIPINISSICRTSTTLFYTIDNKIFDITNKEVFSTNQNFVYITTNKQGNIFMALSNQIHISKDGIIWNTVNLLPRKWVMGCISSQVNSINRYTLCCIEQYGNIFVSTDSGLRWTANKDQSSYFWNSISMSDDGMVQIAVCKENLPFVSYDYGLSWLSINFNYNLKDISGNYVINFIDCSVSEDGKTFLAVANNGKIIISKDNKDWNFYGEYNYKRKELDISDNHFIVTSSPMLFNNYIDILTNWFGTHSYLQTTMYYYGAHILYAFRSFTSQGGGLFRFILPYSSTGYTGRSSTYDVDKKININAEFIDIQFDSNVMFKMNKIIINAGVIQGKINNLFNNIRNLRIMGSNDTRNFKELINITNNSTPYNLQQLIFVVRNIDYYNNFRIVLDGVITPGSQSSLSGIVFEGESKLFTSMDNTVSNWKNVSLKNNNLLFVKDKVFIGSMENRIYTEFRSLNLTDVIISSNTTLTSDIFCRNLTVNSGITLNTNGFRIFCTLRLTNNGIISNSGVSGSGGIAFKLDNLKRPLGMGGNGGDGSTTTGVRSQAGSSNANCVCDANGGNGGQVSGLNGTGGICNIIPQNYNVLFNPLNAIVGKDNSGNIIQGGSGGGGGEKGGTGSSSGGAGGSGGGVIMICAKEIFTEGGFIRCAGGSGQISLPSFTSSTSRGSSGGGGGGGGVIILVTSSSTNISRGRLQVFGGGIGTGQINSANSTLSGRGGNQGNPGRIIIVRV